MQSILITGASSGIGRAAAEFLTTRGHRVVGTSRRPEGRNLPFETIRLDVTDDASVQRAVDEAITKLGGIEVLINNAGFGLAGPIEDTTLREAKDQFETNYFGVVRMTRALLPHMKQNGGGLIVNISSMGGLIGLPFQGHYAASKFALEGFTEALRLELLPFNVHVVNINPGDFSTAFTDNRRLIDHVSEDYRDRFKRFLDMYASEERNGADPVLIARLIEKLVTRRRAFRVRYVVGKRMQTIGVPLKRWLGGNLFERLMKTIWPV